MSWLYQSWAFLRRDYLQTRSSTALLWQGAAVVIAAPTLYYLGRLFQPAASAHLAPFGGNYFAFVILGVALFGFLSTTMGATAAAVRQEQTAGALEALLVMPLPLPVLAIGVSAWHILLAAGQGVLYLLLGVVVYGASLAHLNPVSTLVILLLVTTTFAALGVLTAAFVILFRQADPLTGLVSAASALMAGVFYPTTVLPPLLQRLSGFIPLTYALRAMRLAVLRGASLGDVSGDVLALLLFAVVLAPSALLAFRWAVAQAQRSGTLSTY